MPHDFDASEERLDDSMPSNDCSAGDRAAKGTYIGADAVHGANLGRRRRRWRFGMWEELEQVRRSCCEAEEVRSSVF